MAASGPQAQGAATIRVDKWLWHARFFRTRGLATDAVAGGAVRINGVRVTKPAHPLRPGDTLTLAQSGRIRLIRVIDLSLRRGGAPDAATLYLDLDAVPVAPPLE